MGKKSNEIASKLVLQSLKERSRSKKELKRVLKAAKPSIKKKYTKKALEELLANGKVKRDGKEYRLVKEGLSVPLSGVVSTQESIVPSRKHAGKAGIPIGMKLRESATQKVVRFTDEQSGDIDDEIARLEKELMDESSDIDDSENSSQDDEASDTNQTKDNEPAILSLSSCADDRVESLPSTCLPVPGKYTLGKKKSVKNIRQPEVESGLQQAVKEILGGYTARSSEKIPFYCRFCSKQYENETSFYEHKASEFHKTAVLLERKATYCKLCRKQFTSPTQMKEHLSSRPHKQRLQNVRMRQGKRYS